eukprot:Pgem_evm1s1127
MKIHNFVISSAIACASVAYASQPQCNGYYEVFFGEVNPNQTPQPSTEGQRLVCPGLGNTCCDEKQVIALQDKFNSERKSLVQTANTIDATGDLLIANVRGIQQAVEDVSSCATSLADYDGEVVDNINKVLKDFVQAMDTSFNTFTNATAECLTSGLEYSAGVGCFSCDADNSNFYDVNQTLKIQLQDQVCEDVESACLPLYAKILDLYERFLAVLRDQDNMEFLKKILDYALLDPMDDLVKDFKSESNALCEHIFDDNEPYRLNVVRLEVDEKIIKLVEVLDFSNVVAILPGTCEAINKAKELVNEAEDFFDSIGDTFDRIFRRDVALNDHEIVAQHLLTGLVRSFSQQATDIHSKILINRRRRRAATITPQFSPVGYNATKVGKESGMKTVVSVNEVD